MREASTCRAPGRADLVVIELNPFARVERLICGNDFPPTSRRTGVRHSDGVVVGKLVEVVLKRRGDPAPLLSERGLWPCPADSKIVSAPCGNRATSPTPRRREDGTAGSARPHRSKANQIR